MGEAACARADVLAVVGDALRASSQPDVVITLSVSRSASDRVRVVFLTVPARVVAVLADNGIGACVFYASTSACDVHIASGPPDEADCATVDYNGDPSPWRSGLVTIGPAMEVS